MATVVSKSPKLDTRNGDDVVQQARALAPLYTPEWDAAEEEGAGASLLKIVARLLEGVIRRLNDVPLKNFIAFLDSIGTRLLPALPARAPLTFFLSKGAKEAVAIPARSQVAAKPPEGGDPIIFETEKTILATPAKLQSIVSVVPALDRIIDHNARLLTGTTSELFSDTEPDLQAHQLYLAHDELFNVKSPASFKVRFTPAIELTDSNALAWEYCAGEKETIVAGVKQKGLDWRPLILTRIGDGQLQLDKNDNDEIKQVPVNGITARWIRCRIKQALLTSNPLANIKLSDVRISAAPVGAAAGVDPDAAFYNDLPLPVPPSEAKSLMPFGPAPKPNPDGSIAGTRPRPGDVFYLASQDAFSKKGAAISITIGTLPAGAVGLDVERVQGIGPIRAPLFRARQINTVFQLLQLPLPDIAAIIHDTNPQMPRTRNVREAAAKLFLDKVVSSGGGPADPNRSVPNLSWEYFNGNGWVGIEDVLDTTNALTSDVPPANGPPSVAGVVQFVCPPDIAPTKVVGQENFWIRVRIAFGDYGQEKVTFRIVNQQDPNLNQVVIDVSRIQPPNIKSLKIRYETAGETPQHCLTLNNLAYHSVALPFSQANDTFAGFAALDDAFQSLYLGFDQAPLKGPISIFFSLQEQEYTEENRPRVDWEYFRRVKGRSEGEWARLAVTDGTRNLTQSGTIEFIGPPDFEPFGRFGNSLFWIRAIDLGNGFVATPPKTQIRELIRIKPGLVGDVLRPVQLPRLSDSGSANLKGLPVELPVDTAPSSRPCDQQVDSITAFIKFPAPPTATPMSPIVKGVYLNTAWSVQAETIQDELLGSSDGSALQQFTLAKSPVIEESIWVNELSTLTETERKTFTERKDLEIRIKKDADSNITEFLIRWSSIEDLADAGPSDRVYAIDRTFGLVMFGDGVKHGLVPPIGKDNLKATYSAGGGARGNVDVGLIKSLRSTIPLVESVSNPESAGGGSETELIEKALERGPQVLKNRGRAIAAEDFEWLAKQASQSITRARCLPTFNDQGNYETGWVTVIIVPESKDDRPLPSPQLRQRVERYLLDRAANVASFPRHIKVIPPAYVAVKVLADVFPATIDLAPQVESAVLAALAQFLHPLTGGYQNRGWDFGRFPCLSDFYRLLEEIEGVDHVDNLSLMLQPTTLLGEFTGEPLVISEDRPVDVTAPPFALVYSGEHKVTIRSPLPV